MSKHLEIYFVDGSKCRLNHSKKELVRAIEKSENIKDGFIDTENMLIVVDKMIRAVEVEE